jgi:hypothetical protein
MCLGERFATCEAIERPHLIGDSRHLNLIEGWHAHCAYILAVPAGGRKGERPAPEGARPAAFCRACGEARRARCDEGARPQTQEQQPPHSHQLPLTQTQPRLCGASAGVASAPPAAAQRWRGLCWRSFSTGRARSGEGAAEPPRGWGLSIRPRRSVGAACAGALSAQGVPEAGRALRSLRGGGVCPSGRGAALARPVLALYQHRACQKRGGRCGASAGVASVHPAAAQRGRSRPSRSGCTGRSVGRHGAGWRRLVPIPSTSPASGVTPLKRSFQGHAHAISFVYIAISAIWTPPPSLARAPGAQRRAGGAGARRAQLFGMVFAGRSGRHVFCVQQPPRQKVRVRRKNPRPRPFWHVGCSSKRRAKKSG